MKVDEPLIERIVADVMQQLMTSHAVPAPNGTPPAAAAKNESGSTPRVADGANRVACFDDPVITEAVLESSWNGQKTIQVGPKTILTPTARDFLRSRQIEWLRAAPPPAAEKSQSSWKAIVVRSTPAATQAVDDLVRANGTEWKRELAGSPDEAVGLATSAVCRGEAAGVVVLSSAAAAVACRANRNRKVRAAVVTAAGELEIIRRDIGCNVLVIDPGDKSYFELKNILQRYAQHGPPQPPPGWDIHET